MNLSVSAHIRKDTILRAYKLDISRDHIVQIGSAYPCVDLFFEDGESLERLRDLLNAYFVNDFNKVALTGEQAASRH